MTRSTARKTAESSTTDTPNATEPTDTTTAAAVTDDQGQVTEDSPQNTPQVSTATGVVRTQQYASGEGWEAGQSAPSDLYLDVEKDEIVTDQPERAVLLAQKGETLSPAAARSIDLQGGAPS